MLFSKEDALLPNFVREALKDVTSSQTEIRLSLLPNNDFFALNFTVINAVFENSIFSRGRYFVLFFTAIDFFF